MVEVVYLSERKPIPPKSTADVYLQQRFTCTFDPNAPMHEQWVWQVDFTRTFKYYGATSTLPLARRQARARIDKLLNTQHRGEENE